MYDCTPLLMYFSLSVIWWACKVSKQNDFKLVVDRDKYLLNEAKWTSNHVINPIQKPFLETTKWNLSWKFHTLSSRPYLSLSRFKCEVKDMHHGLHLAISFGPHVLHLLTFTGPISFEVLPTRESIRIISSSIISLF